MEEQVQDPAVAPVQRRHHGRPALCRLDVGGHGVGEPEPMGQGGQDVSTDGPSTGAVYPERQTSRAAHRTEGHAGGRSDRPLHPFPVGVAQLALVELAVGIAWHLGREVDRLGCLELGQLAGAEGQDLLRQRIVGLDPSAGSITAFTSSPQSSWGMPKTAASPTLGCDSRTFSISAG